MSWRLRVGEMGFSWGSRVFLLWSYLQVERIFIWRECFWVINKYSFLCLECARHCSWPGIPLLSNCYFKDKHALKALGLSLSQVQTVKHELSPQVRTWVTSSLYTPSESFRYRTGLWLFLAHWHVGLQRILLYPLSIFFSFSVSQVHINFLFKKFLNFQSNK